MSQSRPAEQGRRGGIRALWALASLLAGGCAVREAARPVGVERARYLMGTILTATAEAPDSTQAARVLAHSLDEIARLENVMSSWRKDSELSRLNRAAGSAFRCSQDLYAVLDSALAIARATSGAFDPTVEPLDRIWDLRGKGRVPSPREIAVARSRVAWSRLTLDPTRHMARLATPGMGVDLGGIGKGFALDRAARLLAAEGIERALLNLGGEVLALSPKGRPWPIAVAHPNDRLRPAVRIAIAQGAVSTSGQGVRGVTVRGKHLGHILDPSSGRPLDTQATVTVVAPSATRADGLSTALLVMGRERALALARRHQEIGVLWIEPDHGLLRAWKWNLSAIAEPGVAIRWMN
ncbi:MAG: FAD:protein FMN transferase [Candidatus Eisenbacteria bacterium]|uniref:FAD:protein FMN transferase n=1 Tax=Eiseniibacteriota bacterium TaxID=2212470 RepID=A0A538TV43_UNCEI|nr:MAG: FAD:protein FMN transferase [Candidatus Eisenbacteria bacterium]